MNNIDMLLDQLITKETPTIVQISTAKLHPFPAHPFKVQDDENMEQLNSRYPYNAWCFFCYQLV